MRDAAPASSSATTGFMSSMNTSHSSYCQKLYTACGTRGERGARTRRMRTLLEPLLVRTHRRSGCMLAFLCCNAEPPSLPPERRAPSPSLAHRGGGGEVVAAQPLDCGRHRAVELAEDPAAGKGEGGHVKGLRRLELRWRKRTEVGQRSACMHARQKAAKPLHAHRTRAFLPSGPR